MLRRLLLCIALLLCPARLLAELQVFELQHADAEALLPIVQPLLGPYESVSVYRNSRAAWRRTAWSGGADGCYPC